MIPVATACVRPGKVPAIALRIAQVRAGTVAAVTMKAARNVRKTAYLPVATVHVKPLWMNIVSPAPPIADVSQRINATNRSAPNLLIMEATNAKIIR